MILIFHIVCAFASLAATAWAFISPAKTKLYAAYLLVALALASGFDLVFSSPAHLTETCITGLAYLILVSFGIVAAHNRLALAQEK